MSETRAQLLAASDARVAAVRAIARRSYTNNNGGFPAMNTDEALASPQPWRVRVAPWWVHNLERVLGLDDVPLSGPSRPWH